jgi:hypothetical protein
MRDRDLFFFLFGAGTSLGALFTGMAIRVLFG